MSKITTDTLSEIYGRWLIAHGYEGCEPVEEILFTERLNFDRYMWLRRFVRVYQYFENKQDAAYICDRWVAKFGLGFNPDTRGWEYVPALSPKEAFDYERDMQWLWSCSPDPYRDGLRAMKRAGLIED